MQEPETETSYSTKSPIRRKKLGLPEPDGFDVVVSRSIGRVTFGDGYDSPYVVAFRLIAETGEEGDFSFPGADEGQTVKVKVVHAAEA